MLPKASRVRSPARLCALPLRLSASRYRAENQSRAFLPTVYRRALRPRRGFRDRASPDKSRRRVLPFSESRPAAAWLAWLIAVDRAPIDRRKPADASDRRGRAIGAIARGRICRRGESESYSRLARHYRFRYSSCITAYSRAAPQNRASPVRARARASGRAPPEYAPLAAALQALCCAHRWFLLHCAESRLARRA